MLPSRRKRGEGSKASMGCGKEESRKFFFLDIFASLGNKRSAQVDSARGHPEKFGLISIRTGRKGNRNLEKEEK